MEPSDDPTKARVRTEKVSIADRPLFSFDEGQVSLFNDQFEHTTDYPFDRNRSALALVATPGKDYRALARFRRWLSSLYCFIVRDGLGPVRVKAFRGDPDSSLSPAELVARGWENG